MKLFLEQREQVASIFRIRQQYLLGKALRWSELYVTKEKIDPFQTAGKLQNTPTYNGFKQVQIAYLAVISNLDKLYSPAWLHAICANQTTGKA